ncbi:hypothetical protein [Arenimonas composti]|uniref:Uncharacterized protein n=1 Tax=Arenimonas composti TR7-09 = DSM 18010 TaxID=1121013 RepID=A0A091BB31_9GAMM|nr:hypothetical protein [Arenimonas composti]KFN48722.1 hypothetical protein P873_13780 [Arenimonas composti TR7-09 = DSM 18010]
MPTRPCVAALTTLVLLALPSIALASDPRGAFYALVAWPMLALQALFLGLALRFPKTTLVLEAIWLVPVLLLLAAALQAGGVDGLMRDMGPLPEFIFGGLFAALVVCGFAWARLPVAAAKAGRAGDVHAGDRRDGES